MNEFVKRSGLLAAVIAALVCGWNFRRLYERDVCHRRIKRQHYM